MAEETQDETDAKAEDRGETSRVEDQEAQDSGDGSGDEDIQMDHESIDKIIAEVEENPPDKLEDWPGGKAKYRTIGGSDANEAWEDGPTANLGPSDLRYYDDGSITIKGEKVDNPDDYRGDPIPGGPTDPDAPPDPDADADKKDDSIDTGGAGEKERG